MNETGPTPFFSILVPHWKRPDLLASCLAALEAQTFRDFEVLVVDGGSEDGSVELARERGARVLVLEGNPGFAPAADAGIQASRGTWVFLLNNDAEPFPDCLEELALAAERHPEAGMLASRILFKSRPDLVDNVGHLLYWDGLNRGDGRMRPDGPAFDIEREAFFPSGCAGAYRRDLLEKAGGFDPWFQAYGDDADLGIRCRLAGAACFYVPRAKVLHRFSATQGPHSARKAFLVERNRIAVLVKDLPWPMVVLSPAATALRLFLHGSAALVGRGSAGEGSRSSGWIPLALALLKAWASAFRAFPMLLRERRKIQGGKKLGTAAFLGLFLRFRVSAWELAFGKQAPDPGETPQASQPPFPPSP